VGKNAISHYRVLLVDDEPFIRTMTARLLKDVGCAQFVEAGNGNEALAILDRPDAHIDLVLCDLAMPDMDGVEIVRHLAGRKERPALAFLSGADAGVLRAAENLARAYGLRILGCLPKPASKNALCSILEHIAVEYQPKARAHDIVITEADLARGLTANELCLHYQPKVRLDSNALDSVEALVRWTHPTHGLLSPDKFVALAESTQLIGRMTEKLVALAFGQAAAWKEQGLHTHVGVNLSPSMLSDVSLPDRFATLASNFSLEPESIVFEITETGVAKEEAIYLEIVTRLHMKGFALSIDDFGTGSSSLQKLEALPFHELKVDRQFVHGAHNSAAKRAILKASLDLAKSLGMKTVAEGVEEREDWDLLKQLNCDVVQGYIVSRPLPHADVSAWTKNWRGQ
jgi:EAL domain-containing protein (putative c-di-GMP-specific phosphodiesterase class I)/AmiR/NasT family two-component response regulator